MRRYWINKPNGAKSLTGSNTSLLLFEHCTCRVRDRGQADG